MYEVNHCTVPADIWRKGIPRNQDLAVVKVDPVGAQRYQNELPNDVIQALVRPDCVDVVLVGLNHD